MLHNHGWEKQQTLGPKEQRPEKGSDRERYPLKKILPPVKRTISNVYGYFYNMATIYSISIWL